MLQKTITLQAPAKVNFSLKVLGRRDDGYHFLATHMQKVGLYDTIKLRMVDEGIQLSCPGRGIPEDRNNLVFRAAELFLDWAAQNGFTGNKGVAITLEKNIPVAAGLGGGSSDAAHTLLGLNALFAAACPPDSLVAMGLQLGADVPFFLDPSAAARATGIGEILQSVTPLKDYQVLLVNPGFSVSTRWVYQTFALTEKVNSVNLSNSQEVVGVLDGAGFPLLLANDLEQVTIQKFPELRRIKAEMLAQGARGALMSGSGPTIFGIFQDQQKVERAASAFRQRYSQSFLVDPLC
ncbi:MAG: 4-(cytidine 5'-diphospho)-2-C-methyl-D-erythritol kinase [Desulfobulbus sp.]